MSIITMAGFIVLILTLLWLLLHLIIQLFRKEQRKFPVILSSFSFMMAIILIIVGNMELSLVKTPDEKLMAENKQLQQELLQAQEENATLTSEFITYKENNNQQAQQANQTLQEQINQAVTQAKQQWQAQEEKYQQEIATLTATQHANTSASASVATTNSNITVRESYSNCTELRKVYPQGVGSDHPAYELRHDRDKDGWACEK